MNLSNVHLFSRPIVQGVERGQQRHPGRRQRIFDRRRNCVVLSARNYFVAFKFFKAFAQHCRRHALDAALKFVVAQSFIVGGGKIPNYRQLPLRAENFHCKKYRAFVVVQVLVDGRKIFTHGTAPRQKLRKICVTQKNPASCVTLRDDYNSTKSFCKVLWSNAVDISF